MNERSIFLAALEIPDPTQRASYLDQACGGDQALRSSVEELIAAHESPGTFLEAPLHGETTNPSEPSEGVGCRIGPYKLLQQIGEGGMGVVFMAEQEVPVRRTVALKIIRPGMDSRAVLARFEAERQALAMMDHPNIARVLDAGTTESGSPYFVMELVKGVPITRFCDEHKLGIRERLGLFVRVCQAIQHAHQKGLLHRDIKPSNVLVALYDDQPVPKVIDFGIAKAAGQKLTDKTLFTAFGAVVGTLEYMSPEQAKLNQLDIDTRSDVYALGVLLYELLTGSTPLDRGRLASAAFDEVLRLIREEEPVRPSTRLSAARTQADLAPDVRHERERLGNSIKGELDWIVMKALEKDRSRRYETANGLARDVQRYLEDESVEACPPTLGYRLRKAYRRNRAAVGVAAAVALLLCVGALTASVLAVRAVRAERLAAQQRDEALRSRREAEAQRADAEAQRRRAESERIRAEQETQRAQAVRDFLREDLLRQASPLHQAEARRLLGGNYAVQNNPTIRELLDRAAARLAPEKIEARFPGMPVVQAEVLGTVGDTYQYLFEDAKGSAMLSRAVDLYRSALGDDHPATIEARHSLAMAMFWSGRRAGLPMMEGVCEARARVQGPDHPDTFTSRERLGAMYIATRAKDTISYLRRLSDDALRVFGPDGFHTLYTSHDLSEALLQAGRPAEALKILEGMKKALAPQPIPLDHPYVIRGHGTLARAYVDVGRPEQAVQLLRPVYDHVSRNPNVDPASLFEVASALAGAMRRAGRSGEAAEVMKRGLEAAEAAGLGNHPFTWIMRHELAWRQYMDRGRPQEAIPLFRANLKAAVSPGQTATTHASIYQCHQRTGRHEEALIEIRKAHDVLLKAHGPVHRSWRAGLIRTQIGQSQHLLGRHAEAEPHLVTGYAEMLDHLGDMPDYDRDHFVAARRFLLDVYRATNRPEAVRAWAEGLISGLEHRFENCSEESSLVCTAIDYARSLGLAYIDAGRHDDAARLHARALALLEAKGWPADPRVVTNLVEISEGAAGAGREDVAVAIRKALLDALERRPDAPRDQLAREYFSMGFGRMQARRHLEAIPYLRKAVDTQAEFDRESWNATKYRLFLGEALTHCREYVDAEPVLLAAFVEAVERIKKAPDWERDFPGTTAKFLTRLYSATNRPQEAEKWQAEQVKWSQKP